MRSSCISRPQLLHPILLATSDNNTFYKGRDSFLPRAYNDASTIRPSPLIGSRLSHSYVDKFHIINRKKHVLRSTLLYTRFRLIAWKRAVGLYTTVQHWILGNQRLFSSYFCTSYRRWHSLAYLFSAHYIH